VIISEIGPQPWLVPVAGVAVGERCAPALHQADHCDDHDRDRQRKQSAPFAGDRKTERTPGEPEPEMRSLPAEARDEGCDPEQPERERENIQHRDPRLHEQHLVEEGEQTGRDRGALGGKQREPAEIHRDDRERTEQHARVAPAQRRIPEHPNRYRHQLLRKRRMHRVEHRARHDRLEHLPGGRHIMHFIEVEFVRCRHADQKRKVRGEKHNGGNDDAPHYRIVGNGS
jgi:hypothetical protein